MASQGVAMTRRTSLHLPPGLAWSEWRRLGRQIFVIADSSAWWLGDWLIYGQNCYPNRYKRAVAETSLDYQTLRNYAWVARKVPVERRREGLGFQHHAEVAGLAAGDQDEWLSRAEEQGWTRNELRRQIRAAQRKDASAAESAVVQIYVAPERQGRWQAAADSAQLELLEWIVRTLDGIAEANSRAEAG
ncbi:LmbU family transcriptional regulator [Catenulispora rubra]|uniref:LmbU family transcriptional regulator n=1 Tax=Catenulispora rubra TaxID=280293 RepID=UPI002B26D7CA|nr:LmbU family transcriptional regulator [Catenulispora rubra]